MYRIVTSNIGHKTLDCKERRTKDFSAVEEATAEEAWAMIKLADQTDNDFGGPDLEGMKRVRRGTLCTL